MDELNLETNDELTRTETRIKDLSSKVRTTAEERDTANAKAESETQARLAAEKERDFYASFSDSSAKFPGASEYKDKIKEKVLSGYTVEDATVVVLNSAGKLNSTVTPPPPLAQVAGGSAPIQLPSSEIKSPSEMSRDEKRNALIEAEKRGDISLS